MTAAPALLRAEHLSVHLQQHSVDAVRDISFTLHSGEVLAVIGASGSGKSLLARRLLGMLPKDSRTAGLVLYQGNVLDDTLARQLRGKQLVFIPQSISCLDPLLPVQHQPGFAASNGLLAQLQLRDTVRKQYPFELSGGMARRVLVACALSSTPSLIIADEPTPGLHPKAEQAVMQQLAQQAQAGAGVILITHDLQAALPWAHRVVVLYEGESIEELAASAFADEAQLCHPYTKMLWNALPCNGFAPPASTLRQRTDTSGCLFTEHCPLADPACALHPPPYVRTCRGLVRCRKGELLC